MPQLGIRQYPKVLREKPKDLLSFKILETEATVLDDGTFYFVVMRDNKQIVGLVPYESIFNPGITIAEVLHDDTIRACVSKSEVIEECLPANWRHTAQQQAKLPGLIVRSLARWREFQPVSEVAEATDLEREQLLDQIEELQKQLGQQRDLG
jgi:hypothetical protein